MKKVILAKTGNWSSTPGTPHDAGLFIELSLYPIPAQLIDIEMCFIGKTIKRKVVSLSVAECEQLILILQTEIKNFENKK